jgi:hypothetical protein
MALSRRLGVVVVVLGLLLASAAGCGGGKSNEDKVRETVTGFFSDVADGKGDAACAKLTQAAVQQLNTAAFLLRAPASCPEAIMQYSRQFSGDDKKALKSAEVRRATVTSDTATVADADITLEISGQSSLFRNNDPAPITLEKVGGDWKISSLG